MFCRLRIGLTNQRIVITIVLTNPQRKDSMHAIKLRKIGNSVGLVLPREILAKLKVREGETIYLTDTSDGFRL